MAPRNHKNWLKKPKVEFISSECYNNHSIYQQEIEQIFAKVWVPVCHTSEMSNKGDYRSSQIAHQNVVAVNRGDTVEAFLCPSIDRPAGNSAEKSSCLARMTRSICDQHEKDNSCNFIMLSQ